MAKDRKRRRNRGANNPGPTPSEPHRENVPGELDHSSGEVDRFEAELVEGAGGVPADETAAEEAFAQREETELDPEPASDDVPEAASGEERPLGRATPGAPTTGQKGPRFINFLRACWAELQRVQWPDRRQVGQATAVVLGFVVIAGAYLGFADVVAQEIVDIIL